ncbi:MAG: alpha/beta fold hydrolase [Acidimicrobiales bacterium]|nr:alpha/beta fold hydrolase [Acidimicrobiales bacterium]
MSFEDSDVVRSAIHLEGFRDDEFDYQLVRALGLASYGGSTVGECLSAAAAIVDGSPKSWAAEFGRLAERVETRGRASLERGHEISGRDHLLRASTYYRMAEYYAEGTTDRPQEIGLRSERCFAEAAVLLDPPVRRLEVPFEGSRLPGYLATGRGPEDGSTGGTSRRPTLVVVGGFDSSAEELYFLLGAAGAERGWNVFTFDGPGQPGCMRADPPLTFRPDYEVPVGAVLDTLAAQPEVDPNRLALAGQSFGAYFAARAAATDGRVAALVVDPPMVDMGRYMESWVGKETFRMARDIRPEDVIGVPEDLMPRQMQWGIAAICRRFGVPSFHAWRTAMAEYRLGEMLADIRCPVLALAGDREGDETRAQFDAFAGAGGLVTGVLLGADDGASTHGQSDNLRLLAQVAYDWLEEQLA